MRWHDFIDALVVVDKKLSAYFLSLKGYFEVDEKRHASALKIRAFLKESFDVFKNVVAVAAFKAFARTVHSHQLAVLATILEFMVWTYVFTYVDPVMLRRSVNEPGLKGFVLLTLVAVALFSIYAFINFGSIRLLELIAKLQTR